MLPFAGALGLFQANSFAGRQPTQVVVRSWSRGAAEAAVVTSKATAATKEKKEAFMTEVESKG
jgi:hypothetical protein